MPIISPATRRNRKTRFAFALIFAVLSLGALTMLYPFSLMLAGSVHSEADDQEITPWPSFWTDDAVLFRKYAESKHDVSLDGIGEAWNDQQTAITYKDININNLGTQVANLTDTVNTMKNENASQRQTIARQEQNISQQDAQMHEVYFIIGTKDELLAAGAIVKEGGLFKKKKVNFANVNRGNLKKADIRQFKSINIPSKKAVIIGDVPEDSYTMTRNENSSTLTITNTAKFWSSNNRVLVIQMK